MSKNGNLFKGNNQKKVMRGKKDEHVEFRSDTDQFAKVLAIEGGKIVRVVTANGDTKQEVRVVISGKHYKKIWFKKDDIVVICDGEIRGKVSDKDFSKARTELSKINIECENTNTNENEICFDFNEL